MLPIFNISLIGRVDARRRLGLNGPLRYLEAMQEWRQEVRHRRSVKAGDRAGVARTVTALH